MKIRVYTGFFRRLFFGHGLRKRRFHERKEPGLRYFQRHVDDDEKNELKALVRYCRHRLLPYSVTDDSMERSPGCRSRFFKENRGVFGSGIYLCAYCGKPVSAAKTAVDHIIPVKKAGSSGFYKKLLTIRGIKNVNDVRNLAPSCVKCNLCKSSHGGIWVIRGMIGRSWVRVLIKEIVFLVIGAFLLYGFYNFLDKNVSEYVVSKIMELFS